MNAIEQAMNAIERAKNLKKWKIVLPVPEEFEFRGVVPFDISIRDGIMTCAVWAVTPEEAKVRVYHYINGSYEE